MPEFWEESFRDKQEMWGDEPADSAIDTMKLFRKKNFKKILIPGYGYGRNAKVFTDNGCDVTGIEISETAISLAKQRYGNDIKVFHGSVSEMPFDDNLYDGIFCYSLIHLLNPAERVKLINDCYNQLNTGGYMVFIALSDNDLRYGQGSEIDKNTFVSKHGVTLFFYDEDTVKNEFGEFGLSEVEEINEPVNFTQGKPVQKFQKIVCVK